MHQTHRTPSRPSQARPPQATDTETDLLDLDALVLAEARSAAERQANDYGLLVLPRRFPGISRFLPVRVPTDEELKQLQSNAPLTVAGDPTARPVGSL